MKGYLGKHIEFTNLADEQEVDFDEKMRAKVVAVTFHPDESDDPHTSLGSYWTLHLDFSFWEEYNVQYMKPNYYDKDNIPQEKWNEQKDYPSDGLTHIYYTPEIGKTLFNIVPMADVEEKATDVLKKIHELINQKHISDVGWHDTHALQEIMKVVS